MPNIQKSPSGFVLFLACFFLSSPSLADTFIEQDGVLIVEAESSPATGDWSLESAIGGYSGTGYLRWSGPDAFAVNTAGRGTITYSFRIQRAGYYELLWRSRITVGNNQTEHNDSWVRFPTGRNIDGEQGLNGWTKVFMSTLNQWVWQSATVDNVGRRVRQYFSAGDHTFQISGRSNGHAIDRIALFDYTDGRISTASFDSRPSSPTAAGSPAANPQPEPSPDPDPGPETETPEVPDVLVEAPDVSVNGNVLSWSAVDAKAINVHRGNGDWIESLSGAQTQWRAPATGEYFLVATGEQGWETWGRSNTVSVQDLLGPPEQNPPEQSPSLQLSAQVYSSTALELFWVADNALDFEVRRDGQLLLSTDGRSYFDDQLSPGTQYNYALAALNAAGNVVANEDIEVSTTPGTPADGNLNLRAQVYSQTALEMFWDSVPSEAAPVNYQIYVGSDLLATLDARSFFIENLTMGTSYDLTVIAVDSSGNTLLTESVSATTLEADK